MSTLNPPVGHIQMLIQDYDKNIDMYRKLFKYFDFHVITDADYGLGVYAQNKISLWIMKATVNQSNNRDSNGLNHLAFSVKSKEEVDQFTKEFLKPNNIECLFDTPRERPDFTGDSGTYYQVMFEFPGSILFEVVYTTFV